MSKRGFHQHTSDSPSTSSPESPIRRSAKKILSSFQPPQQISRQNIKTRIEFADADSASSSSDLLGDQFESLDLEPAPQQVLKKERCICRTSICRKLSRLVRNHLPHHVLSKRIACQSFRDVATNYFGVGENKSVNAFIKVLHIPLSQRSLSHLRSTQQFIVDGEYLTPNNSDSDMQTEVLLCVDIYKLDTEYYINNVQKWIEGRGDKDCTTTFDLASLHAIHDSLKSRAKPREFNMTMKQIKENPSWLLANIIHHKKGCAFVDLPKDISDNEYMFHYLNTRSSSFKQQACESVIECIMPESICSRRKTARPAKQNSNKDLVLRTPTDIDNLRIYLLPMNEAGSQDDLCHGTDIIKTFYSQGRTYCNVKMKKYQHKKLLQTIYIDEYNNLPHLVASKRGWRKSWYYCVGDELNDTQLESVLNFVKQYNIEWLAAVLLIRIRHIGKMNQERAKEDILQDLIFCKLDDNRLFKKMTECSSILTNIFDVLLKSTLKLINEMPNDLNRIAWASWAQSNRKHDYLFSEEDQYSRAKSDTEVYDSKDLKNKFRDYSTILTHSQDS